MQALVRLPDREIARCKCFCDRPITRSPEHPMARIAFSIPSIRLISTLWSDSTSEANAKISEFCAAPGCFISSRTITRAPS
jgi:hypothetical protein